MNVTVKSGFNHLSLNVTGGETIAEIYSRAKTALNITDTSNMRVIVDGDSYDYADVANDTVTADAHIEFVKESGSKGI